MASAVPPPPHGWAVVASASLFQGETQSTQHGGIGLYSFGHQHHHHNPHHHHHSLLSTTGGSSSSASGERHPYPYDQDGHIILTTHRVLFHHRAAGAAAMIPLWQIDPTSVQEEKRGALLGALVKSHPKVLFRIWDVASTIAAPGSDSRTSLSSSSIAVKISFRNGGHDEFREHLLRMLQERLWASNPVLLGHSPAPAPSPALQQGATTPTVSPGSTTQHQAGMPVAAAAGGSHAHHTDPHHSSTASSSLAAAAGSPSAGSSSSGSSRAPISVARFLEEKRLAKQKESDQHQQVREDLRYDTILQTETRERYITAVRRLQRLIRAEAIKGAQKQHVGGGSSFGPTTTLGALKGTQQQQTANTSSQVPSSPAAAAPAGGTTTLSVLQESIEDWWNDAEVSIESVRGVGTLTLGSSTYRQRHGTGPNGELKKAQELQYRKDLADELVCWLRDLRVKLTKHSALMFTKSPMPIYLTLTQLFMAWNRARGAHVDAALYVSPQDVVAAVKLIQSDHVRLFELSPQSQSAVSMSLWGESATAPFTEQGVLLRNIDELATALEQILGPRPKSHAAIGELCVPVTSSSSSSSSTARAILPPNKQQIGTTTQQPSASHNQHHPHRQSGTSFRLSVDASQFSAVFSVPFAVAQELLLELEQEEWLCRDQLRFGGLKRGTSGGGGAGVGSACDVLSFSWNYFLFRQ